ncbi:protein translocase subunit SecF [Iamia sp.]|uniref:protein translocase subunit SecF n=1 Tax=Iamia sp. TaxID=2722710 RepID=UPI002B7701A8|nr:protein translocase subunit SecF [Iamia sp.]HXH58316.1 protein translocase subunit SecF [Iamia sp.]
MSTSVPTAPGQAGPRNGLLNRLYHGETEFRFVPRARRWFAISGAVILIGLLGFAGRGGLNLGIDFTGGSQWEVPAGEVTVSDAEDAIEGLGFAEVSVQEVGDALRVQTPPLEGSDAERTEASNEVIDTLSGLTGAERTEVAVNEVGPSWGQEISEKALRALVFFLIAIVIYITVRFELRMALAIVGGLVHDLIVVVGVYAVLQLPVTPATVVAILTILGFSIYDGIVVFDRVDENTRLLSSGSRMTYSEMVDLSLNQVLMRSLNTQITAIIPILSVLVVGSLVLGQTTLQEFGLALFLGQLTGAYSSIFIASPLLAMLKEREPRYRALRQRLSEGTGSGRSSRSASSVSSVAPGTNDDGRSDDETPEGEVAAPVAPARPKGPVPPRPRPQAQGLTPATRTHPPRPRKQRKKR